MDILLSIIAIVCGIMGILGAILPIIPGTLLSFAGMVCAYFCTSSELSVNQLWIWGAISIVIIVLDYILPGYFSKLFGGSKAGIIGATIGVLAGMIFMGPIGILIGPFAGAVIGELLTKKQPLDKALVVGFGSLLSFFVGTGLKLIAGGFMMYYIWIDVFQAIKDIW
ncbi:MAG: DUF456 domain-containing protein [Alistipes sp.]|nr:DUF456 domain-containing protein [Alistipes sp.]